MQVKEAVENMCEMVDAHDEHETLEKYAKNGLPKGVSSGWEGFDSYLKIMKGQLNVLSGCPGTGKSEWLESLAVNLALQQKWRIFFYSPEEYPVAYFIMKLMEKVSGKPFQKRGPVEPMTTEEKAESEEFICQNFEFVNPGIEPYNLEKLLFTIEYKTKHEKKIDMAVIDPWNELEHFRPRGQTETDYIGEKLMWCRRFARKHGISLWIVVHPTKLERKKDGTYPEPSMYDLSGSQHWYNKSDNGIILHRTSKDKAENTFVKAKIEKVKNRFYGRVGEHFFSFISSCGRFNDYYPNKELAF